MDAREPVSAFAGIVSLDGSPIDRQAEDPLTRCLTTRRKGRVIARRHDAALFAQRISFGTGGGSGELQLQTSRDGRKLFAAVAQLDNRDELGSALGLEPSALARTRDAELLLRLIERRGDAGVAQCLGAFVFALWDADERRLILGRDCLGHRPLFYHRGSGVVTFATTLNALLVLPGVPRELDEVALANFMAFNNRDQRRTVYRGIARVPSRTLVTIDRARIEHRHYWSPDLDAPPPYAREDDYVERARELFDRAVAATLRDTAHVAISASGGLDSSAIAATAARLGLADRITCYVGVPPPGTAIDVGPFRYLDERDKVEALARMHPALAVRLIAPERPHSLEEDSTYIFVRAGLPLPGPSSLGWYSHLYDAVAQAGHRALLVGLAGNFGLTWSGEFSLLALLRARKWAAFAHEWRATARESGVGLMRTLATDVLMPVAPLRLRRLAHRSRGRDPDDVAHFSALNPHFVAELDLVREWRAQGFDPWYGRRGWNAARHRADYLFDNGQLSRDLRGMTPETHGFEMRDPHADRRLLEFLLTVPEPMHRRDGVPRSFARRVLADRLPQEILHERRRGVQTPTWFRSLDARRQDISVEIERLDASPLASRLIDLPRLKRLMAQWPKDEQAAERRRADYRAVLARGVHVGRFIRWVEGGNA